MKDVLIMFGVVTLLVLFVVGAITLLHGPKESFCTDNGYNTWNCEGMCVCIKEGHTRQFVRVSKSWELGIRYAFINKETCYD